MYCLKYENKAEKSDTAKQNGQNTFLVFPEKATSHSDPKAFKDIGNNTFMDLSMHNALSNFRPRVTQSYQSVLSCSPQL